MRTKWKQELQKLVTLGDIASASLRLIHLLTCHMRHSTTHEIQPENCRNISLRSFVLCRRATWSTSVESSLRSLSGVKLDVEESLHLQLAYTQTHSYQHFNKHFAGWPELAGVVPKIRCPSWHTTASQRWKA